jgi:hypothetical protein
MLQQHLKDRHMFHKDVIVDKNSAIFMLWNLSGQLTGYQQYIPFAPKKGKDPRKLRYFTRGGGVWGLQYLIPGVSVLYVTEGIFDAVKLQNLGLNAIALLGNSPKTLKLWLGSLGYTTVAVCDGDRAGLELAKYAKYSIILPEGKDLGDMEYLDILKLL